MNDKYDYIQVHTYRTSDMLVVVYYKTQVTYTHVDLPTRPRPPPPFAPPAVEYTSVHVYASVQKKQEEQQP